MSADGRAWSVEQLAERTGARRGELRTFLSEHPHLVETGAGWVNVLRLADGLAFTHELSAVEREAGVLAEGGEVRAFPLPDLPAGLPTTPAAGEELIGQALVGPPGWLAGFQAGGPAGDAAARRHSRRAGGRFTSGSWPARMLQPSW